MLLSVWRYRNFIVSAIRADIKNRFANSRVAGFWLLVQPLVQVAIFATILSSVLSSRLPGVAGEYSYAIYLLAGISVWSLFSETLSRCMSVFVENGGLLKKISFPRVCLPLIVIGAALVNFTALIGVMTIFLLVVEAFPGAVYLWLLPLSLLTVGFAAGLGILLGVVNVFVRDLGPAVGVLLNLWFWSTPIVYPKSIVPEAVAAVLEWNPLLPLITSVQDIVLKAQAPHLPALVPIAALALVSLALAAVVFRRAAPEMVDVL
ncbi:MAG TPA: ABC transporter permease [Casimicrobiaceae bacterium]|nr:ABC transporter permease [Casimicrobiaceae bacterium]